MITQPRLRKFALTAHVTTTVGWLGAVVVFLALAVIGLASQDAQTVPRRLSRGGAGRLGRPRPVGPRFAAYRDRPVGGHQPSGVLHPPKRKHLR
jgi:hypothetical protein